MKFGVQVARHEGRQCPKEYSVLTTRTDDLKFEYLNEVENVGNFKSNSFSGDFGRERTLHSMISNPYGRGWWKSPLG
jgi:hypothetical protein